MDFHSPSTFLPPSFPFRHAAHLSAIKAHSPSPRQSTVGCKQVMGGHHDWSSEQGGGEDGKAGTRYQSKLNSGSLLIICPGLSITVTSHCERRDAGWARGFQRVLIRSPAGGSRVEEEAGFSFFFSVGNIQVYFPLCNIVQAICIDWKMLSTLYSIIKF